MTPYRERYWEDIVNIICRELNHFKVKFDYRIIDKENRITLTIASNKAVYTFINDIIGPLSSYQRQKIKDEDVTYSVDYQNHIITIDIKLPQKVNEMNNEMKVDGGTLYTRQQLIEKYLTPIAEETGTSLLNLQFLFREIERQCFKEPDISVDIKLPEDVMMKELEYQERKYLIDNYTLAMELVMDVIPCSDFDKALDYTLTIIQAIKDVNKIVNLRRALIQDHIKKNIDEIQASQSITVLYAG